MPDDQQIPEELKQFITSAQSPSTPASTNPLEQQIQEMIAKEKQKREEGFKHPLMQTLYALAGAAPGAKAAMAAPSILGKLGNLANAGLGGYMTRESSQDPAGAGVNQLASEAFTRLPGVGPILGAALSAGTQGASQIYQHGEEAIPGAVGQMAFGLMGGKLAKMIKGSGARFAAKDAAQAEQDAQIATRKQIEDANTQVYADRASAQNKMTSFPDEMYGTALDAKGKLARGPDLLNWTTDKYTEGVRQNLAKWGTQNLDDVDHVIGAQAAEKLNKVRATEKELLETKRLIASTRGQDANELRQQLDTQLARLDATHTQLDEHVKMLDSNLEKMANGSIEKLQAQKIRNQIAKQRDIAATNHDEVLSRAEVLDNPQEHALRAQTAYDNAKNEHQSTLDTLARTKNIKGVFNLPAEADVIPNARTILTDLKSAPSNELFNEKLFNNPDAIKLMTKLDPAHADGLRPGFLNWSAAKARVDTINDRYDAGKFADSFLTPKAQRTMEILFPDADVPKRLTELKTFMQKAQAPIQDIPSLVQSAQGEEVAKSFGFRGALMSLAATAIGGTAGKAVHMMSAIPTSKFIDNFMTNPDFRREALIWAQTGRIVRGSNAASNSFYKMFNESKVTSQPSSTPIIPDELKPFVSMRPSR